MTHQQGIIAGVLAVFTLTGSPVAGAETPAPVQPVPGQAVSPAAEPIQVIATILVDPETIAQQKAVTVHVKITGIDMADQVPPSADAPLPPSASAHQARVHYRVDQGPIIDTPATTLTFRDLSSGTHAVTVQLVDDRQQPIGPSQLLMVVIP